MLFFSNNLGPVIINCVQGGREKRKGWVKAISDWLEGEG